MGVPKHRVSRSRRDKRRTHQKTGGPNVTKCPQCGEAVLQHHACTECGTYKGRTIIETGE